MKTLFTLKPLAVVVAAAIGLSGCNGESQVASSPDATQDQKSASVKLAAKFPAPEAGASWIGSASEIEVDFYRNQYVGSLAEADEMLVARSFCQQNSENPTNQNRTVKVGDVELQCYDLPMNGLKERFAVAASLTSTSPTASVNLMPGKYRVEAHFYDAQGTLRETSVSYVTFTEGEHQVALKGVSATWTAQTPIALSLLNQSHEKDWDPDTEGVQTPAEALGLTGNILGLHLPSLYGYSGVTVFDQYEDDLPIQVLTGMDSSAKASAAVLVPIWRMATESGETNLYPYAKIERNGHDEIEPGQTSSYTWRYDSLAGLLQQYEVGENQAFIELGNKVLNLSVQDWSDETKDWPEYADWTASILMGVSHIDNSEGDVHRQSWDVKEISYQDRQTRLPVATGIKVTTVGASSEDKGYEKTFLDILNGRVNTFSGGNTINGFVIETIEQETDGYDERATPALYLDASLQEIAQQAGLTAMASSGCSDLQAKEIGYSNEYRWDNENNRWVAGTTNYLLINAYSSMLPNIDNYIASHQQTITYNQQKIDLVQATINSILTDNPDADVSMYESEIASYQANSNLQQQAITQLNTLESEFLGQADLNQDGEVQFFEDGVYFANGWSYRSCSINATWDDQNSISSYQLNCDNAAAAVSDVQAWSSVLSAKMCIQPFTLEASELAIDYGTDGGVIVE
ncbi:hypothetical protein BOO25_19165 [Vibrio navarrensis]|uniref:hypothetical protein n=1 Tax=Vibrio navarrensis TaxID=29495 RepID=UPI00192F189B|nr:hypothetical protein [Vibrio navarrensis]MBE3671052.1 hypothetical protein [Vibrio navarrensis]